MSSSGPPDRLRRAHEPVIVGAAETTVLAAGGIPERLRRVRKAARLSCRKLSLLADLAQAKVGQIERNPKAAPSVETMAKLAGVLGVSLDWLIAGKGTAPTPEELQAAVTLSVNKACTPSPSPSSPRRSSSSPSPRRTKAPKAAGRAA